MGSQLSDFTGVFGLLSCAVAIYFFVGLRTAMPSRGDVFESVAWGKFFVALVYACMAVLFFWMAFSHH